MNQLITLIIGAVSIIFIAWYFFGKKNEVTEVSGSSINIKVDGGYSPSQIMIKKNQPVSLKILRIDLSDCLADIIIPEWKIKKSLPLNKEIVINLKPDKVGEFPFHCGMNMFHGRFIVQE